MWIYVEEVKLTTERFAGITKKSFATTRTKKRLPLLLFVSWEFRDDEDDLDHKDY